MKKVLKNTKFLYIVSGVLLTILFTTFLACIPDSAAGAADGEPGTDGDPLVTLSYLDVKIQEIWTYFDGKISDIAASVQNLDKSIQQTPATAASKFEIVTLSKGRLLICDGSTEFILRTGEVTVVTGSQSQGGLSDVTQGANLANGQAVARDHHIIVPRSDGRGVAAVQDSILMVKGAYVIQ